MKRKLITPEMRKAFKHIQTSFPTLYKVKFTNNGWLYMDKDSLPFVFDTFGLDIDDSILEEAYDSLCNVYDINTSITFTKNMF